MVGQLFRQEAVDGYTERWLGEVSELPAMPQLALALLGVVMLTSLVTALIFGSYIRQTTFHRVISGAQEKMIIAPSTGTFRVGETLLVDAQPTNTAKGPFVVRVTSVVSSSVSGRSVSRVDIQIPSALRREVGVHFMLRAPLERRRIYQWMLPCLFN